MKTLKQIETELAAQITAACKITWSAFGEVEVTCNNTDATGWTISGKPAFVDYAVQYVESLGLMKLDETAYDEELDETFAYLTA